MRYFPGQENRCNDVWPCIPNWFLASEVIDSDVLSCAVVDGAHRKDVVIRTNQGCGRTIPNGSSNCAECAVEGATERLASAAKLGRVAAQRPEARAKHAASRKRNAQAQSAWDESSQPAWLAPELFSRKIQPLLARVSTSVIRSRIRVSRWYASRIRQGYRPHPRHWEALAKLVGVSPTPPTP